MIGHPKDRQDDSKMAALVQIGLLGIFINMIIIESGGASVIHQVCTIVIKIGYHACNVMPVMKRNVMRCNVYNKIKINFKNTHIHTNVRIPTYRVHEYIHACIGLHVCTYIHIYITNYIHLNAICY